MNDDHTPVHLNEIDLRRIGVDPLGQPLARRAEPLSLSKVMTDQHQRGRELTRVEIEEMLADNKAALDVGRASPTMEALNQLYNELRVLEVLHSGTWEERLTAIAKEIVASKNNLIQMAGHHVEISVNILKGAE